MPLQRIPFSFLYSPLLLNRRKEGREGKKRRVNMDYIYGRSSVMAALNSSKRRIRQLLLYEGKTVNNNSKDNIDSISQKDIANSAIKKNIPIQYTTNYHLNRLSQNRPHQNVILHASQLIPKHIKDDDDICINTNIHSSDRIIAIIPSILDPQNLGSVIRNSFYFGIDKLILGSKECCSLTPTVSRSSAGALEMWIDNIYQTGNIGKLLLNLRERKGFKIVAAISPKSKEKESLNYSSMEEELLNEQLINDSKDDLNCNDFNPSFPIALLFGSESGLSSKYEKYIDKIISIKPQFQENGIVDSLNLGVATGIIFDRLTCMKKYYESIEKSK